MGVAQKIIHFYCWTCREYHLKAHPHFRAQKQRLARRKARRRDEARQQPEDK